MNLKTGELSDVGDQVLTLEGEPISDLQIDNFLEKTATGGSAIFYDLYCVENPVKMKDPDCRLALVVKAKTAGQTIKMYCNNDNNSEPCFDAPNNEGYYDFASNGYTKGNGDFTFSTTACNPAVISVGAYVTTNTWVSDYLKETYNYPASSLTGKRQEVGEICDFSSYGIDDNGMPIPTFLVVLVV